MSLRQFIDNNMPLITEKVHYTDFKCLCEGFEITQEQHLQLYFKTHDKSNYIRDVFDIWLAKKERTVDDFIYAFFKSGYITFSKELRKVRLCHRLKVLRF